MSVETLQKESPILRSAVVLTMILLAAALRIAPHPWNLTPVGAIALFCGASIRDRRLALVFPLLALFAGDIFIGFHKLMPIVYASFLVNVMIGFCLERQRTAPRIAGATLLGAIQFFITTNFAVWLFLDTYPKTLAGCAACYAAALPLFWNTLTGDAFCTTLLFGGFALVERIYPSLREPAAELGR
jgi:hypothetical protein